MKFHFPNQPKLMIYFNWNQLICRMRQLSQFNLTFNNRKIRSFLIELLSIFSFCCSPFVYFQVAWARRRTKVYRTWQPSPTLTRMESIEISKLDISAMKFMYVFPRLIVPPTMKLQTTNGQRFLFSRSEWNRTLLALDFQSNVNHNIRLIIFNGSFHKSTKCFFLLNKFLVEQTVDNFPFACSIGRKIIRVVNMVAQSW